MVNPRYIANYEDFYNSLSDKVLEVHNRHTELYRAYLKDHANEAELIASEEKLAHLHSLAYIAAEGKESKMIEADILNEILSYLNEE